MKITVTSRGGESAIVGKYAAQRIRSAIESANSYGTAYVAAEINDVTDSLRAVTTDYATVTEDDGTELWAGWLDGRDEPAPLDNAAEIMRLRGALEDIARAAQGHADSTGTIDHNWLVETALRGLGWMPASEDEGGDVRPREGDPGMKDVTCGSCGEEFGTNFEIDEIECPECEARRCPHCRRWFGGEQ